MNEPHDTFPTWMRGGAWTYEFGVSILVLWLAESVRHFDHVRLRYVSGFPLWDLIEKAPNATVAGMWLVSLSIGLGFTIRHQCPRCAYWCRVGGMLGASAIFGIVSVSFLTSYPWSIAGGMAAFLCWRTFAVACAVAHRCSGRRNASADA